MLGTSPGADLMRGPQPRRTNRARVLRSRASSAHEKMWSELRDRRLGGLKFVREYPMGPFFADFVCRAEKVIVEIDGGTPRRKSPATRRVRRTCELIIGCARGCPSP